jgi:hypothetical protein
LQALSAHLRLPELPVLLNELSLHAVDAALLVDTLLLEELHLPLEGAVPARLQQLLPLPRVTHLSLQGLQELVLQGQLVLNLRHIRLVPLFLILELLVEELELFLFLLLVISQSLL